MNKWIYFWLIWFLISSFPVVAVESGKQKVLDQLIDLSLEQLMDIPIVTASKHEETIDDPLRP